MSKICSEKQPLYLYDDSTVKWAHDGRRYCLHIQRDEMAESPRKWDGRVTAMACWHRRYDLGDDIADKNPEEFWRKLVRENVSGDEICAGAETGRLRGIRIARNEESPALVDVYETAYWRSVLGNSEPQEFLEYEGINSGAVAEYILDDLTVRHCQTLLEPYAEWMPLWLYDHSGITLSCGERTYPYNDAWDSGCVGWIVALKSTIVSEARVAEETWRRRAVEIMRADVAVYDQYLTGEVYGYTLYEAEGDGGEPLWEEMDCCWGFYGADICGNGILENMPAHFHLAFAEGRCEIGKAKRRTMTYWLF